jgi:hypothetical protein
VFRFRPQLASDGRQVGQLEPTGLRPRFADKLALHGVELPAKVFHRASAARPDRVGATRGGVLARGRRR